MECLLFGEGWYTAFTSMDTLSTPVRMAKQIYAVQYEYFSDSSHFINDGDNI